MLKQDFDNNRLLVKGGREFDKNKTHFKVNSFPEGLMILNFPEPEI